MKIKHFKNILTIFIILIFFSCNEGDYDKAENDELMLNFRTAEILSHTFKIDSNVIAITKNESSNYITAFNYYGNVIFSNSLKGVGISEKQFDETGEFYFSKNNNDEFFIESANNEKNKIAYSVSKINASGNVVWSIDSVDADINFRYVRGFTNSINSYTFLFETWHQINISDDPLKPQWVDEQIYLLRHYNNNPAFVRQDTLKFDKETNIYELELLNSGRIIFSYFDETNTKSNLGIANLSGELINKYPTNYDSIFFFKPFYTSDGITHISSFIVNGGETSADLISFSNIGQIINTLSSDKTNNLILDISELGDAYILTGTSYMSEDVDEFNLSESFTKGRFSGLLIKSTKEEVGIYQTIKTIANTVILCYLPNRENTHTAVVGYFNNIGNISLLFHKTDDEGFIINQDFIQ